MRLRTEKNCWQQDIKPREYMLAYVKCTCMTAVIAWLYYRSFYALLFLIPVWIWYYRAWEKDCVQKKMQEFQLQFKEAIQSLSSALNVGYSVENAMKETQKELVLLYPEDARILSEFHIMVTQIRVNVPMEQILEEFAGRVGQEDVRNFVTVFVTAKRSGGDMIAIIRNTSGQIGDKIEVKREIQTVLSSKQYEFKVMSVIPFFIIGYMSFSFPEFMQQLYGNIIGTGVMTVCLILYMGAYWLGLKIISIEI